MPYADCSTHPLPYGFMDLIAVFPRLQKTPAWTAVAAPSAGYLWFALRDAEVLPQTAFWMSNGGRHAPPWKGVNRCLGVEDGCAYYTYGLADSLKKNTLNRAGIPTALSFTRGRSPCVFRWGVINHDGSIESRQLGRIDSRGPRRPFGCHYEIGVQQRYAADEPHRCSQGDDADQKCRPGSHRLQRLWLRSASTATAAMMMTPVTTS
jgi:hypothetical protein